MPSCAADSNGISVGTENTSAGSMTRYSANEPVGPISNGQDHFNQTLDSKEE